MRKLCILLVSLLFVFPLCAETADTSDPEARLLSNIRQLTFEGKRAGEGYFSTDGSRMVFQSERAPGNPFFQIYLLDLETGDTEQVSTGIGKTTCAWIHPDGTKVLFASTHEDPEAVQKQKEEIEFRESGRERRYSWDYDPHYDLFVRHLDGGKLSRLTDARGYDAEGAFSPDGNYIVFSSNRHAYSESLSEREQNLLEKAPSYFMELYIMRSDGTGLRRLTRTPGYDGGPFFSADGTRICWRRFSEDGLTAEIYTMNPDGTDVRRLTDLGAMSWAPFFHPSGDYLVFATNLHGFSNFELYLVDARGEKEPVRVTSTEGFDGLPAFSPDGKSLAWTSNRTGSGQSQIFLAGWDDQEARELLGISSGLETTPEISQADLKLHVEALASEEMAGRLTGTEGARLATEYGARVFRDLRLEPAGDEGTYFQAFEFTSGVSLGDENRLTLQKDGEEIPLEVNEQWRPLAFSRTGDIDMSEVVFAGYGIVAPEEDSHPEYDSYVHLDVSDRWVMVFRYLPEDVSQERRQHLARYAGLRFKAMAARERGARGLLVVSGPTSQVEDELVDLAFDASLGTTSLAVVSITDGLAGQMLDAAERDLGALQTELDQGEPVMGFALDGIQLGGTIDIVYEKDRGRNVVARLPGYGADDEPALVLGAHIDHLGRGQGMSTLATKEEEGEIHYGADDNASGVSGLFEIAQYLNELKKRGKLPLKRDIIFGLWSGEELGLLGSHHFVQEIGEEIGNSSDVSSRIAAYLNLDMVGRLDEKLILQGIGSSSVWSSEIERRNAPVGLSIQTQNDSYLPTDSTSFYLKQVPVLSAFTGTHGEYHSPRDVPSTLNYEGLERISRFMALVARGLAVDEEAPDYQKMERPTEQGSRMGLRAYLGTIPDYAQGDVPGVPLSGVVGGGPAEEAGLEGGDIIVELAGRTIENIYDYTYAIEALKIGKPVTIVVKRDGERMEFEITPRSRD